MEPARSGLSLEAGVELNDGFRIPRLGFGTFGLDAGSQAYDAVLCALEAGYRHIDCARFYANEHSVGQALKASGLPREDIFVTSKVWNDRQLDGTVRESVEESLEDLGLAYLDLLMVHWPVEGCYATTWKVFEELQGEGLVRSLGVSNFQRSHLEQLLAQSNVVPAVNQMEHHPYLQDSATRAFCDEKGIVYEAWSPLGRGNCLEDETVVGIAQAHAATPAQVILAWHQQSGVVPIPRSKNPERIRSNAQPLAEPLTEDELRSIDALNRETPVMEGIDPQNFAPYLNSLSSHFTS